MPAVRKLTVSLPQEHSELIDQVMESGSYESASEVAKAGFNALQEYDLAVERWLRDEVATTCEEIAANPDRVVSADEVHERFLNENLARGSVPESASAKFCLSL